MTHQGNPNPDLYKWCTTGQHFVLRDQFSLNRSTSDGLQKSCVACDSTRNKRNWLFRREQRTGWTDEQYQHAFNEQEGRCAICGNTNGSRALCADHDHTTGQIRRLLCDDCNRAIGLLADDPERAERIATYLREFRS